MTREESTSFWREAKAFLKNSGVTEKRCGSLIGKWRKSWSDEHIMEAIDGARFGDVQGDHVSYIHEVLRRRPMKEMSVPKTAIPWGTKWNGLSYADWDRELRGFRANRIWGSYLGDPPGNPGCRAPSQLLAIHGLPTPGDAIGGKRHEGPSRPL